MPNKVTYTGVMGPGSALTATVFNDVTCVTLGLARGVAEIVYGTPSRTAVVEISATTTITDTIVAGAHTIVISQ